MRARAPGGGGAAGAGPGRHGAPAEPAWKPGARRSALALLLAACGPGGAGGVKGGGADDSGALQDSGDSGGGEAAGAPTLVIAGGGSEGEEGDPSSWSARLYAHLLDGGDVTGDGSLQVAILSTAEESEWLPRYMEELGADSAWNLRVASRAGAEEAGAALADADAVFIKGGDQGEYYDLWQGSALQAAVLDIAAAGGGVGGTSAGAMSLAQPALAGGMDLISRDVLEDACTEYLDDEDGGSGLKEDFFGLVPALVDTHFVERARLGRLAGALARAVEEGPGGEGLLGIGLEAQTGLWIRGGRAEVVGEGSVTLLHSAGAPAPTRDCGSPLRWSGLRLDRLIEGMAFELADPTAIEGAGLLLSLPRVSPGAEEGWEVRASENADEEAFEVVVERNPEAWALRAGGGEQLLRGATGLLQAQEEERRAANDEALFQALATGGLGLGLLADGDSLLRVEGGTLLAEGEGDWPQAALVIELAELEGAAISAQVSDHDAGEGGLHPSALVGARLHVIFGEAGLGL